MKLVNVAPLVDKNHFSESSYTREKSGVFVPIEPYQVSAFLRDVSYLPIKDMRDEIVEWLS